MRLRRFFRSRFGDVVTSSESSAPSGAGHRNWPFSVAARRLRRDARGSALLEFAITLPLLVVFVVGIFDFSGAFNQKQKIEQAAQEGAILAGAQPMSDIQPGSRSSAAPASLQPVVTAIFNSLVGSGVLPNANVSGGSCMPPFSGSWTSGLTWTYTISGCSGASANGTDNLVITIDRGWVCGSGSAGACPSGPPFAVGTMVKVDYPYYWKFNSVIQLLVPGANYAAITQVTESATVLNQM
ncbi:MAG: TadE/TadG family type IV pilus assembly protein [Terriglobales bacterium]